MILRALRLMMTICWVGGLEFLKHSLTSRRKSAKGKRRRTFSKKAQYVYSSSLQVG